MIKNDFYDLSKKTKEERAYIIRPTVATTYDQMRRLWGGMGSDLPSAKVPGSNDGTFDYDNTPIDLSTYSMDLVLPPYAESIPLRSGEGVGRNAIRPGITVFAPVNDISSPETPLVSGSVRTHIANSANTWRNATMSTFSFMSAKTGRKVSGRGPNEKAKAVKCETSSEVLDYLPYGLQQTDEDGSVYTPDMAEMRWDGSLVATEMKADRSHFRAPATMALHERVAAGYADADVAFEKCTGAEIRDPISNGRTCSSHSMPGSPACRQTSLILSWSSSHSRAGPPWKKLQRRSTNIS